MILGVRPTLWHIIQRIGIILYCNYLTLIVTSLLHSNFVNTENGTLRITSSGVVTVGYCGDGVVRHATLHFFGDAE